MSEQAKQVDERPAPEPMLQDLDAADAAAVMGGFRITNVRGNASGIGSGSTALPSQIVAIS